jgi:hypothetical protein
MRGGLHRRKAPTMETAFDSIASMQSSQMMEGVADVAEEMMTMQRPKRIRSAIVWSILVIVNNMIIICAAFFVVQRYMQVESDAFKPDLYVRGSLEPEALDVTTDQEEQTVRFVSRGEASAASVRAATSSSATLVLGKSGGSSDWQIDNDPMDKLVFSTTPKGQNVARSDLLVMDGVTKTSTLSTHVDIEDYTAFGAPLLLSSAVMPSDKCTNSSGASVCGAGYCDLTAGQCSPSVSVADILLAPSSSGSIRFNAPVEPVKGDLTFKIEERIVVRQQRGAVGGVASEMFLENTKLAILNPAAASCVELCLSGNCPAGVADQSACRGHNTLRTLSATEAAADPYGEDGSLSLSDVMYLHPDHAANEPAVSLSGDVDAEGHQIIGGSLSLIGRTNITMQVIGAGGEIVMDSPLSASGPIYPRDPVYQIDGDPSSGMPTPQLEVPGTLQMENLQFELLELNRPDSNPEPDMVCDAATTGRHGMVRLTQDASGQKYHLYLCRETGWFEIMTT